MRLKTKLSEFPYVVYGSLLSIMSQLLTGGTIWGCGENPLCTQKEPSSSHSFSPFQVTS